MKRRDSRRVRAPTVCAVWRRVKRIDALRLYSRLELPVILLVPHHGHRRGTMVTRPAAFNPYEFVVIASLRAKQLLSGSVPRAEGDHCASTMAQMEVAAGKVGRASADEPQQARQCLWQL